MKFWDSSAIVPLLIPEIRSLQVRKWHEEDPAVLVWTLTPSEIWSAVYRKIREGGVTTEDLPAIAERVSLLAEKWSEVVQVEVVQRRAIRLMAVHTLASADALQLASALTVFDEKPEQECFITFDARLADAARKEGFTVIPASQEL